MTRMMTMAAECPTFFCWQPRKAIDDGCLAIYATPLTWTNESTVRQVDSDPSGVLPSGTKSQLHLD